MKILHVTPSYFPATHLGGTVQFLYLLCNAFKEQNADIEVISTNAGLESREDIPVNQWIKQAGVPVRYFEYYGYLHYNFSPTLFFWLLRHVKNYDVVHITAVWNFTTWAAATVCRWYNIPYVISPQGALYPETINLKSTNVKKLYYQLFTKKNLEKATLIHYTTQDEQRKVTDFLHLHSRNLIVPLAINLRNFENISNLSPFAASFPQLQDKSYILFLGRVDYKKGLDILIDAFAEVHQHFPDRILVIAGPDNDGYGEVLKKQIQGHNLTEFVFFTGMLDGNHKLAAYYNAEVFVLSSYSENFGMTVVEAMAAQTPVVISDHVGLFEEVKDFEAGIVTTVDAKSTATGLIKVLQDKTLQQKLVENGNKIVKQLYDIQSVASQFLEAYSQMAKASKKKK
jgi:glycosyltransferase involved in cell wall biosynthesis